MNNKSIIFDLGGVLIDLDFQKTVSAFEELGMVNFEASYRSLSEENVFENFETGQISSQHFINKLLPYLKPGTSPNKVVQAWNAMILSVAPELIGLLSKLKSESKIVLLSNTNELHLQVVRREWMKISNHPIEDSFHSLYFSHEINRRKPNLDIFNFVCEKEEITPNQTLFIDDSIENINGAKKSGLLTHHFTNRKELIQIFS